MGGSRPGFVATVDCQGNAPEGQRWRAAFVWELVDPGLLGQLIAAAASEELVALNDLDLDPDALADAAKDVFGALAPQRAMRRVAPVLMELAASCSSDSVFGQRSALWQAHRPAAPAAGRDPVQERPKAAVPAAGLDHQRLREVVAASAVELVEPRPRRSASD